jgi:TonB family protein
MLPGGKVEDVQIVASSGDDAFDQSVVKAVYKASPFAWPDDPKVAHELKSFKLNIKSQ